jgi:hypothetical protein
MRFPVIQVLAFAFLLASGQSSAAPQVEPKMSPQQVYAAVSDADRQELRTAVETLLALEKSGDWGAVYDQFYLNDGGLTRKQFIDKRHRLHIAAFVPKQIYYVPPSQNWVVCGCAVFSPPLPLLGGRRGGFISSFTARRTQSGWRFDAPPALTIYKDAPSGVRSCAVGG